MMEIRKSFNKWNFGRKTIVIPLQKIGKSILRIITALAIIFGVLICGYWIWQPGSNAPLPVYTDNAIWLGHGWLGDDVWFRSNNRDTTLFRDVNRCQVLLQRLHDNGIATVYPHLCPAQLNGRIAPCDNEQVERFLDVAAQHGVKVIPWIGGVFGESARPADKKWRSNFVSSVDELLKKHPRLVGVQVNIEPMPSGNNDFLLLLDELRTVTSGRILNVAAYPPPTRWHPVSDVHWDLSYIRQVACRCDQLAVMMYDTAIPLEKIYIDLVKRWTKELSETVQSTECRLILGIPAYEDADVGYHHPKVENITSAMKGISSAKPERAINGIAIYCEWEMNERKWKEWQRYARREKTNE